MFLYAVDSELFAKHDASVAIVVTFFIKKQKPLPNRDR